MGTYIISLLLGGMLGRIAGPIAQDFFENETNMGKRIAKKKEEKEIEKENRAYLNRIKDAEQAHQLRLSELREQIRERREDAEAQFIMAHSEAKMKTYLQDCWPLRNPFDAPLAIEPIYNEASKRLQGCRLKTILTKNSQEIVPLRFISAHLDTSHPIASTINSELSIFLVEHYKTNGEHGVISEIGAWKNSIPVNDASITYLFQGMQGQPVMVLVPEYINNGATVRFKIYSWGLGEKLTYPVGFDFGSLDLEALYNRVVASENTKMCAILKKVRREPTSDKLLQNDRILKILNNEDVKLDDEEKERLLTLLSTPVEINNAIRKNYALIVSNVFKALVGMYADGYHLFEYGTLPKLPRILPVLGDISFMYKDICAFYSSLINAALLKGILSISHAIDLELKLCENIKSVSEQYNIPEYLLDNIRLLNLDIENNESHKETVIRLRNINNIKYLPND